MLIDIRQCMSSRYATVRLSCLAAAIACVLPACSTSHSLSGKSDAKAVQTSAAGVNCMLPGQLRQLGTRLTYLTPRKPVELSERECRSRGGQIVVAEKVDPQPIRVAGGEVEIRWSDVEPDGVSVTGEVIVGDDRSLAD